MTDPRLNGIANFLKLMDRLRADDGCPWDRAQDSKSLRPFLLEEAHEVLEALDEGDPTHLREELGDLLFQIVFHARIHEEDGHFHFGDVAQGITDKLIRRHPHVFGDADSSQAKQTWEQIKKQERGPNASVLDGVPVALPALARSQRLQDKAARVGFDWDSVAGVFDKIREEIGELQAEIDAQDAAKIQDEMGDLLFSMVALCRHLEINSEDALREANRKFDRRFRHMEQQGQDLHPLNDKEFDALWQKAKREVDPG